jgi:hypothetical protein
MKVHFRLGQSELDGGRRIAWLLQEVLDRLLQPVGDDAKRMGRWLGVAELDLVEEGAAEVVACHRRQADAERLAGRANPLA